MSSTQLELNGAPGVSPHWVDQVAELLPEERRLAWYRDLSPWLRGLPAEDEFGRIAYAMGFLALLVRDTPPLLTDEREKFAKLLQQLDREMGGAVKTTATYHQQLQECLNKLPGEIAKGVSPQALAAQMVEGLRQQFHQSGMPEVALQLKEQVKELKGLLTTQGAALGELKSKVGSVTEKAAQGIETLDRKATAIAEKSERVIETWDKSNSKTMLMLEILALLIAFMLGVAACWNFFPRTITQQIPVPAAVPVLPTPKTQPTPAAKKPVKRTHANSQQTQPK